MKKWHWLALGLLILASIIVEFVGHHATHEGAEPPFWATLKTFWIFFGALGCAAIIVFAKMILGPVVYKKEDYYNE